LSEADIKAALAYAADALSHKKNNFETCLMSMPALRFLAEAIEHSSDGSGGLIA
jgi:hypothetical protein